MLGDLLHIFFPALCIHCGKPLVGNERHLCTHCLSEIPWTHQASQPDNIAEMRLSGRIPIHAAASLMTFKKGFVTQSILHAIKYHGNTHLAHQFGCILGTELISSGRFDDIEYIVPVPLHWWRKLRRGYNQSQLICEAMSEVMAKPVISNNLYRRKYTSSQTRKSRADRLDNMRGVFAIRNPQQFEDKHILLVDDILTTGSTTEGCYQALSHIPRLKISVATLAITNR